MAEMLGASLKRLRRAAGLTQEELADRAGISARTVSDAERGLRTAVYADTARRLSSALGLGEIERQTFERLARGRAPEAGRSPAPSLPEVLTPILGRRLDLLEVAARLADPAVRLLTLTGVGGIGKTRLAIEATRHSREHFAGGVFFVSLAEVREPSLVAPALARALGVPETGPGLEDLIRQRLAGRAVLVVLDTFEHVLGAAALVYSLMLSLPDATFLVTSRSALRVRGEWEFEVPPLDPDAAEKLFVERARAVRTGLEADASSRPIIADICERLEGIPLAIELAAARVRHLPLAALRDQLVTRLPILTGGPVDLPLRQRAMRDTIAWSHDLLTGREAALFRRLAVFHGGFDLESVAAVCGREPDIGDSLKGVSALLDRSLVLLSMDVPGPRYRMLDVVREYAAERLTEAGEFDTFSRRHAEHFLTLAEEAERNMTGAGQDTWYRRLDGERGNLRRALAWVLNRKETVLALRFTVALWRFWRHAGEFAEGRRWSDAAIALPGDAPDSLRAKAMWGTAFIAYPQGDYARMAELAVADLEVARRGGDSMDVRNALTISGQVAMCEGRYEEALAPFAEALDRCREHGRTWQLATSFMNLGNAVLHAGDPERAGHLFEEGLVVYRELGDVSFAARTTVWLAHVALAQGRIDDADRLAAEALGAIEGRGDRLNLAEVIEVRAAVAAARGDAPKAAELAAEAAAIRETIASRPPPFEQAIPFSLIRRAIA